MAGLPRTVEAEISYIGPMDSIPYFYAKDHERDQYVNSLPARFVHVDVSKESFDAFAERNVADHPDRDALLATPPTTSGAC